MPNAQSITGSNDASTRLRGCPRCGLVQTIPAMRDGQRAMCTRCGDVIAYPSGAHTNRMCAAIALAALICYPLGILLPVLRLEELGHVNETSIWAGSISLLSHGEWIVGVVVLLCSIVIPIMKLLGLFILTMGGVSIARHHKAIVYQWIEIAGRWGMIDVLLVAVLIAALKLGDLVSVTPGPGVVAFAACVGLSLLASAVFDPHAVWDE